MHYSYDFLWFWKRHRKKLVWLQFFILVLYNALLWTSSTVWWKKKIALSACRVNMFWLVRTGTLKSIGKFPSLRVFNRMKNFRFPTSKNKIYQFQLNFKKKNNFFVLISFFDQSKITITTMKKKIQYFSLYFVKLLFSKIT